MSRCPGCGRCSHCGQPAPNVSPYPHWPNVPYVPAPLTPYHPPTFTPPYRALWTAHLAASAATPQTYSQTAFLNTNGGVYQ